MEYPPLSPVILLAETPETEDCRRPGLLQDRYGLCGTSQWIGPQLEEMQLANSQIYLELNSTQDNPVIDVQVDDACSSCDFQGC